MATMDVKAREWTLEGSGPIVPGHEYSLKTSRNQDKRLVYGVRDYGVNLNWSDKPQAAISFRRSSGSSASIKYGETVALHVKGGNWLYYKSRTWGINLDFSSDPKYEWEILGEKPDTAVQAGVPLALYNAVEKDMVVYCSRPVGINLRWGTDCEEWFAGIDNATKDYLKEGFKVGWKIAKWLF